MERISDTFEENINETCILECLVVCDDWLEMVFERLVFTDKHDSVASQESNSTMNPLMIITR